MEYLNFRDKISNFTMGMKVIQKKKILAENFLEQFIREIKIQLYLDHPNIIKIYGLFSDENNFYILMELGCDGQLYDIITQGKVLTEEATSIVIHNLLQACHHMHSHNILHRDIKP
jgi:serine/threonine protein kinase